MTPRLRKTVALLLAAPVMLFVYVTVSLVVIHRARGLDFSYEHAGTDLTFASSDGVWRGEEDLMNGREFPAVLRAFELYRLRSHQPEVRFLRTKPWKKPWKWAWWFDRRSNPKWKVPYMPLDQVPTGPTELPTAIGVTAEEQAEAHRAAEDYMRSLQ
ncbi:MAG: hypothetical protein ABIZ81_09415 [Opitutaceae bacterium]